MLVLGIESTAHTFGAGVVRDGNIISNVRKMYTPHEGGIHPREAADHHVRNGPTTVKEALARANVGQGDLDLVCFSKGPGLGPCLRIGATIARGISIQNSIPIVGVNHCVAHLEIGQLLGCEDPVLLYASGGNTQVIAYVKGRYRILGETLDIGIGNMMDKFGREIGLAFPAGPKIEKLANGMTLEGEAIADPEGIPLLELPYSVKGMDVSYSGILTAALALHARGADIHSLCKTVQEVSFSMLCEVAERAMAHIGATELLLGGGVACNSRLKEMARIMTEERGGVSYSPSPELAVDNGAMIAYLGAIMHGAGISHSIDETIIDQRFRTDQVPVTWKKDKVIGTIRTPGTVLVETGSDPAPGSVIGRGAEAIVTVGRFGDITTAEKRRVPKGYRHPEIERALTLSRVRSESRMLIAMRGAGIRTPYIFDVDEVGMTIRMELLRGPRLASILNTLGSDAQERSVREMGRTAGILHRNDMVHGDLTTSNFIMMEHGLGLIDCSLAERTEELEKKGVDLRLFFEVFHSTHQGLERFKGSFRSGYDSEYPDSAIVWEKLSEINSRGRYLGG
jgi:N6-L-threonylcarbamoyladenine synthase/protein kinase Bud32